MMRHPGHRSGAARLIVGGALAAGLFGASAAWACTPQATITINDGEGLPLTGPVVPPPAVNITVSYPESIAPEGTTVVVTDGAGTVLFDVPALAPKTTINETVRPTLVGIYNFDAYVTTEPLDPLNPDHIQPGSLRNATYIVTAAAPAAPTTPVNNPTTPVTNPTTPVNNPTTPVNNPATPVTNPATPVTNPATGTLTPLTPGTPLVPSPAVRTPAPSSPAAGPTAAPVGIGPVGPAALIPRDPAIATPRSEPRLTPAPLAAPAPRYLAPVREDLWSGLTPSSSAPSLLDPPSSARTEGDLPVGAALLGIGLLALAGVGAIAGRRRLVLARLPRS